MSPSRAGHDEPDVIRDLPDSVRRDVALYGPLLAQIGRDGNTYAGRARSGMLEGCEMIFTGDKRLHSRGHKKPPVGLQRGQGLESANEVDISS